jgi:Domain of unknown function (DUF4166)
MLHPRVHTEQNLDQKVGASPVHVDPRFRQLVPKAEWNALPLAVRKRFSKKLSGGATAIYVGRVTEFRISKLGRILAQALRLIGAPLPVFDHINVPTVVTVTEDVKTGGQIWTRAYANRTGFPQVIHSAKRFSGPTGLEEHVGCGVSMLLQVKARTNGITFESAGYQLKLFNLRITLPRFMTPGKVTVTHMALEDERFQFAMTLKHPLFGELIYQAADYGDVKL